MSRVCRCKNSIAFLLIVMFPFTPTIVVYKISVDENDGFRFRNNDSSLLKLKLDLLLLTTPGIPVK